MVMVLVVALKAPLRVVTISTWQPCMWCTWRGDSHVVLHLSPRPTGDLPSSTNNEPFYRVSKATARDVQNSKLPRLFQLTDYFGNNYSVILAGRR